MLQCPISRVVLFEDRAEVTRKGSVSSSGQGDVFRVDDVSPVVSDAHLHARLQATDAGDAPGNLRIEEVWVERHHVKDQRVSTERLAEIEASVEKTEDALSVARKVLERLEALRKRNGEAGSRYLEQLGRSLWVEPKANEHVQATWQAWQKALENDDGEWAAAQKRVRDLHEELGKLRALLHDGKTPRQRLVTALHLRVSGAGEGVPVEIGYVVPCAMWRPSHEADLDGGKEVRFATYATVWQNTGEDWKDVALVLSTARPSAGARLPALSEDRIRLRMKTSEEKKRIVVQHRSEVISAADSQGDAPGVDDGGEIQTLAPDQKVSIPSSGRPHRVALGSFTAAANVARVCLPEQSPHVFLRASIKNAGGHPILAGPVTLREAGSYVGLGSMLYVGPGEDFVLSFGSDDRFTVQLRRRRLEEDRLIAKDRVHFVTEVDLAHTGDESVPILLTLRFPISELKQLKVTPSEKYGTEGIPKLDRHGLCTLPVSVEPGREREVRLGFLFEKSDKVVVPDPW
jgi:uncharacterized protein (TIGR02231 family)